MGQTDGTLKKQQRRKKFQLYKPKKKKSAEEDAAIQYLQAQYDKIVLDDIRAFKDLPLSQKSLKGLRDNNYTTPTEIQRQAIVYALQGKDVLGAAKTGSGKTLAFLIPILENLFCKKWTRMDGVGALVISPTRELAYQIYETLRKVGYLHDFSAGLIIGGQNLKFERGRMDQVNILICTPGRLLQHMDENPLFDCNHLQILVLDEADRCLDMGFEATMNAIIENLPPVRQTLLFSATQTKSVRDLARLSLSFPTYVAPHEQAVTATPDSLQQSYIVCNIDEKVGILWSFIKNHLKQKVLVFMATCKQVKYIYELFCKLRPGVSLLALYGKLHQEKRESIYNEFCRKSNVVLFATDLASRGLDFPRVNWVIQVDCPEDVETYIHRAGRTARGIFGKGEGLLMLLPHEEKMAQELRNNKIPINKISVDPSKVVKPQRKIEALLSDNSELKQSAQRAFHSYLKSVYVMKNKDIFNISLLDTDAFARSLGLITPPTVRFMHKYKGNDKKEEQFKAVDNSDVIKKLKANANADSEGSDQSSVDDVEEEELQQGVTKVKANASADGEETDGSADEEKQESKGNIPKLDFRVVVDSDEDDCIYTKQATVENVPVPIEESKLEKKTKPLTKAAVVKRILKKDIKVNKKIKFTENEVFGPEKNDFKLESAKQYADEDVCGIGIAKIKEVLQEEDKYDIMKFREKVKAKHKNEKRKLRNKTKEIEGEQDDFGSQSESDGPDLSWLPDPDKIYTKEDSNEKEQSANRVSEEDQEQRVSTKRKVKDSEDIIQETVTPRKLKKIQDISSLLSVKEAEAFAMHLLQAKR